MPNIPFRRGPKIGPNAKCPCGSGRKFKICHGGAKHALPNLLAQSKVEKLLVAEGQRLLEEHKARELQRQKQQGLGRPIISTEHGGIRFVAVGNRSYQGKWKTFFDFLGYYITQVLDRQWGAAEMHKPLSERHPVLQWFEKITHLQAAHAIEAGAVYSLPLTGAAAAYNRLAYNLYLIAHNGQDIETRLISRLKNKENFQGAFFETQVAAWMIRAGFELEYEDETDTLSTHCEFTATYIASGDKYSVEAKSRAMKADGTAPRRMPVGKKLREALAKKANHKRLVFIDLNKPLHRRQHIETVTRHANEIIDLVETIEIEGKPAPSAYVCLTNMSDQYALDSSEMTTMMSFRGFKIGDFVNTEFPSLRDALRARERHWPIVQLMESMKEHREIPATFDGELPSKLYATNQPPRIQVGRDFKVPGPDGTEVLATITSATVMNGKAMCAFHDPATDQAWLGTFEMTPEELADYEKHPDTYFGVYAKQNQRAETPMELFDFFFESYRNTPKARLIELLADAKDIENVNSLSQKELAEELSIRYVHGATANRFKGKQNQGQG